MVFEHVQFQTCSASVNDDILFLHARRRHKTKTKRHTRNLQHNFKGKTFKWFEANARESKYSIAVHRC